MQAKVRNQFFVLIIGVLMLMVGVTTGLTIKASAYPGTKTVAMYSNGEFFTQANDTANSNNTIDPIGVDAIGQVIFTQTTNKLALMASNFMQTLPLKEGYYATRIALDAFISTGNVAIISIGTEGVWALGGATPGVTFAISHNAVYAYYGNNDGSYLDPSKKISEGDNGGIREGDFNKIVLIIDGSGNATIEVNGIPCAKGISVDGKITTNYCAFGLYGKDLKIKNFTLSAQGKNYSFFGNGNQSDEPYSGTIVEKDIEPILDPEVKTNGTSYYFSTSGSDTNVGTSESAPWKTLGKIENIKLTPNDKVLLKRGDVWQDERLTIAGSGSPSYPIVVSAYGDSKKAKPIISLSQGEDDIAVVINDFLKDKNGNFVFAPIQFFQITELDIRNTRLGIYVRSIAGRETPKHSKNRNTDIVIKDCDFNNIVCPDLMNYLNDKNYDRPTLAARVGEKLHQVKGNLPWSSGDNYVSSKEQGNKGGKQEYIFPAAIFIGGYKMVPSKGLAPCMQNIRVLDCNISEASAGIMMWMYFNYGGAQANLNVYKNVNIENVNMTGVINGGLAFDGVNGGAADASNNKVEPIKGTSATDKGVRWGLIENMRVISGTDESYNTFINGTTGAIFNNTSQFLINNSEFGGVTNQGNNDGCGFDFETYCKNVEIRSTTFHNNEGGAILIMDSQEQYGVKGPHKNLFFNGNYFYNNNVSQPAEYRTINIYSKAHRNIQFNNNVFVMPTKSVSSKAIVLGKPAAGVVINDDLADPDTFTANNEVYYYGTKVLGNESFDSIENPTEFDLVFSGGIATVKTIIDLNVYKKIKMDILGQNTFDGVIILENLLGEKFEKPFSTTNGYIDLVKVFGANSAAMHTPIRNTTLKISKAGGATGSLKYTLAVKTSIDFLSTTKAIITSGNMLPFSGEDKANFSVKFNGEEKQILSATKIGIDKVEVVFSEAVYAEGTGLTKIDVQISISSAAYKRIYKNIINNFNFDKTECSDKIFVGNKTEYTAKAVTADVKIEIESKPVKTSYTKGEALNFEGLTVSVTDNNGEKRLLKDTEYTISDSLANSATVTISYNGHSASFNIDIADTSSKESGGCSSETEIAPILIFGTLIALSFLVFVARKRKKNN